MTKPMGNSPFLSPQQGNSSQSSSISLPSSAPLEAPERGVDAKDELAAEVKFLRLLEEMRKELQLFKLEREKLSKYISEHEDFFENIKFDVSENNKKYELTINMLSKERALYNLFNGLKCYIYLTLVLSFFAIPIIGLIFLYFINPNLLLEKFTNFYASWLTYLVAGIGCGIGGSWFSIHKRIKSLESEVSSLKKERNR